MKLTKKTTKEHFNKYEAAYNEMKAKGINLESQAISLIPVKQPLELLETMFKQDNILNNIPLKKFDALFPMNLMILKKFSLADNTCVLKHTMIYKLLKVEPIFED
jgi:hypothetical protein